MTSRRRLLALVGLGAGAALLLVMVAAAGPSRLAAEVMKIGPVFLAILPISFSWFALNSWGWRLAFEAQSEGPAPRLGALTRAYVAAEALNNITPFMAVGGEPLKIALLLPHAAAERTAASVIGDNVVHALTAPLFMLAGLALGWVAFDLEHRLALELLAATAGIGLLALVVWVAVGRGLAGLLVRLAASRAARMGGDTWHARAARVDALTTRFLDGRRRPVWASLGLHLAGRVMGAVEAWIILAALGVPCSLAGAIFLIAIAHVGVNLAFAVIPAQLGVQEAAAYATLAAVGLDPASGVTLMIVRRIRGFIWIAVGLALAARSPSPPLPRTPSPSPPVHPSGPEATPCC